MATKKVIEKNETKEVSTMENVKSDATVVNAVDSKVTVNDAVVISVTSPSSIERIAKDKNLNPQEVFVRCTFEYAGRQFTASNKLRFLTKVGYKELLDAKENKTPMKFVVDVEKGFFYIEHDVSIDSLFEAPVEVESKTASLTDLLNA